MVARATLVIALVIGCGCTNSKPEPQPPTQNGPAKGLGDKRRDDAGDWDKRVRFVCCNDHGDYSPAVYMRLGGGSAAFETVREAAPFMLAGDPGSAAAGLCGFLFKRVGYDADTAGTLVLEPPPKPGKNGTIDWKEYGSDADVILINVDRATAKCCFGSKSGQEIRDVPLGGR